MRFIAVMLVTVMILAAFIPAKARADGGTDYVLDRGQHVPIPLTYTVKKVITSLSVGPLNGAQDIFIDKNDLLYVADTGNNRILKLTKEGQVLGAFTGQPDKPFKNPKGVYVDDDGDIYVADTGNGRIVHLSPEGRFIEEFTKPESAMLANLSFDPVKIYINPTGYIYILNESNYQGFMTIDANNNFRGYLGSTRVKFTISQWLIRNFATEAQKARLANATAPPYSNFVIDEDGMVYATAINIASDQIRKLNSVGKNIYASGKSIVCGEGRTDNGKYVMPYFVDLAVDENGVISALERENGKVYQYDQDGNLLTVFGGKGNWKGVFQIPSSIALDSGGNIYVLDGDLNTIQVFAPTKFIQLIHEAVKLYSDGRYDEARDIWQQVLKIDANYELAHRGIAKALFKEERWKESMEEYKAGNDPTGYSQAFAEYRHALFRAYFGWGVLALIILVAIVVWVISRLKTIADAYLKSFTTWDFVQAERGISR